MPEAILKEKGVRLSNQVIQSLTFISQKKRQ
jgi:hypothetical protein